MYIVFQLQYAVCDSNVNNSKNKGKLLLKIRCQVSVSVTGSDEKTSISLIGRYCVKSQSCGAVVLLDSVIKYRNVC